MRDTLHRLATALAGRYDVEHELGGGGMAVVYLARDLRHDRRVAIKVLRPELAAAVGTDRFLREMQIAAQLTHPHILLLIDSGTADGLLYYVMPYVEGESLRQRLTREGRLPVDAAVGVARQVADALAYAHGRGVVHRDVKPENILFEAGHAVVSDFGIAHAMTAAGATRLTQSGFVPGTPRYMSPEQASGEADVDGRSDVYALACVLYEMLAGEPPITGPTAQAILARHLSQRPVSLTTRRGDVPDAVAGAVARALAKTPDERYATAADFAAALGAPAGDAGAARRRRLAITVAAVVVAGLVATAYFAGEAALDRRATPTLDRHLAQLTFDEGVEEWPAWSPLGTHLAYVAEVGGLRQVFILPMTSGASRQLTHGSRDHFQPAWSADGRRVAFVRSRADAGRLEPTDINGWYPGGGDIWTVDFDGTRQEKLVDDAFHPAFSPDGAQLVFDAAWAGPRRIWVADGTGRNPRQVTSDSSEAVVHTEPCWSPDGWRIAFRRIEKTESDILIVDLRTQQVTRVTDDHALAMDPAWSADGRHVYFASSRGGGVNLWRAPLDATSRPVGPPQQMTTGAGDDIMPAPAPAGHRIVFAVRALDSDLWRLPVSPTTARPTGPPEPVVATTRFESRGAWAPDGRAIALNTDRLGAMNLWLHPILPGPERQITTGTGGDYQPQWLPDGASLVFFSARGGNSDIWKVRVGDGALAQLTDDPRMDMNPFPSPDGARIAFMSDRSGRLEVWLMNADGTGQRQLTAIGVGGHFLRWSADGGEVMFRAEHAAQKEIYRVAVSDGSLTRLPDVASGAHMSLSPDRSLILDVRGHKTLWAYPSDGGTPYQVFQFPDPEVRIDYPVWSPDGRWVLFDRAAPRGGDIWLLEGVD